MITHYGLFWSERDVFWRRPNNPGELLGRVRTPLNRTSAPNKKERKSAQDFRDYIGIYCLYGGGELLYVGEAGLGTKRTLFGRLNSHRRGPMSGRWDSFSWFGRRECRGSTEVKVALSQVEAIFIAIVNPGFNKKSGTFAGATQVFQVPHENAEGDIETRLARLATKLDTFIGKVR